MRFLTKIHEEKHNNLLLDSFDKLLIENNYPYQVKAIVDRIRKIILGRNLYMFIDPETHYSFLHGDFKQENVQKDKENGEKVVIDWASSTSGPHFLDILNYLSLTTTSYSEIREYYLDNEISKLTTLEKIFFIYGYTLMYIVNTEKHLINTKIESCLLPAIEHLEKLSDEFMKYEYDNQLLLLEYKNENTRLNNEIEKQDNKINKQQDKLKKQKSKLTELEKQLKSQSKEYKTIDRKYNDALNSRSWKITAPLRKINNLIQK